MPDYKWGENPYKTYPPRGVSGTDIVENPDTSPVLIGHTLAWCNDLENAYNEALAMVDKYYNRLVELGDIIPPKTAEEIAQEQLALAMATIEEQNKTIEQNTNMMMLMMQKLENIGGVDNGHKPGVTEITKPSTKGNGNAEQRPEHETGSGTANEPVRPN